MSRLVLSGIALVCVAAAVIAARHGNGGVSFHQIDGSGVKGTVILQETDYGLIVRGTATGLDPDARVLHLSLLYNPASKPSGPRACRGHVANVGAWEVDDEGNGTLYAVVRGVRLASIGTMSIRANGALVACGKVTRRAVPK